jgi:8-oxo-dGTP pyrophosphatase MutT (NUDIX family)
MGQVDGVGDGGAGAADGAKRRRRRRPKRASARVAAETATTGSAKTGTPGREARGSAKTGGSGKKRKSTKRRGSSQEAGRKADQKKGQHPRQKTGQKTGQRKGRKRSKGTRKAPAVPTKREISAGGVVYRREGDQIEVVLASRRTRRGGLAWGLAKGGIEDEESAEDAAVREVREETGLLAEIEASLGETRYFYVWEDVRIRKTVHFFLMRHTGGDVDDRDDEMEEIRWFPLERALKRAAYRGERDVLGRAAELLR